jgi:hypothetical protein
MARLMPVARALWRAIPASGRARRGPDRAVTATRLLRLASAALLSIPLAAAPAPRPAVAQILAPAGFTATVYFTGHVAGTTVAGIPSVATLAFDANGVLYLARSGRRYTAASESDDLQPIYRLPPGGARLAPETERQLQHGPPLRNPQVAAVRGGREVLLSTFDPERKIGVLYRLVDGRAEIFAGGTPPAGMAPVLRQPEGAAVDAAGNVYVADRAQGVVVRLDPTGRVLDPAWAKITRPRVLAVDDKDHLWIGADGEASAPWQSGPGEIWRVSPAGEPSLVLRGPVPAAIAPGPGGHLFVADRQGSQVFALAADGRRTEFARFVEGSAPRSLVFAPDTPETRRAGFAGDLFVVLINRGAFQVNEVIRVSGPFESLVRPR